MNKKLVEIIEGTIENIFIPEVYEDGGFVDESFNDLIGFNIKTKDGILKIIEKENDINLSLYKKDNIKINKYVIVCDYNNYNNKIKELVDLYFSNYNELQKQEECSKYYIPMDKYNVSPRQIIEYEIVGK